MTVEWGELRTVYTVRTPSTVRVFSEFGIIPRNFIPPTHSRTWWHALQVAAAEPVRERERGVEGLQRRDRLAVAYAQRAALLLEEQVAALGLGQRERDREAARAVRGVRVWV